MKQGTDKMIPQEWFRIGEDELKFAKASLEEFNAFYPQICYLCQQATEKYLKGFLIQNEISFEKIHDLVYLLKLCAKKDEAFLGYLEKGSVLSQYGILTRYPIEYPPASQMEAKEALEITEELIDFIKKKVQYENA